MKKRLVLLMLAIFTLTATAFSETFNLEETQAKYSVRDYAYSKLPARGYNYYKVAENAYFVHDDFEHMVFFVTDNGVVVVDPMPAVTPYALKVIPEVTDKPITHVVYSHHHADHAQGAYLYPESATLIANEDVAKFIEIAKDPKRPMPEVIWKDEYTLKTGGLTLEMKDLGRNWHSQKDIIMYAPEQKILFAVDMFHADAAPWIHFGESSDPDFAFQLPRILLDSYDFNFVVTGHERIAPTRAHMEQYEEMIEDMKNILYGVVFSPEYQTQMKELSIIYDEKSTHYLYKASIFAAANMAAEEYIKRWSGRVRNASLNAVENMQTMFMHIIVLDPEIEKMQKMMAEKGKGKEEKH